ncbi:MAG: 1-deoxy-D-xylulose-5-phosphate reductoisomerase [Clostridia bacterium]|nr:1-deoxy-D-xylulose-5-phosphate reductoisomerase [Clostridia bacterium]
MKKRLAILGATGSIGSTALSIVRRYRDLFEVVILANDSGNLDALTAEFKPKYALSAAKKALYVDGLRCEYRDILSDSDVYADIDIVINGIAGIAGLAPGLAALKAGKTLATANKESFVAAGALINSIKDSSGAQIIPLDSEHSAVWQCIGNEKHNLKTIVLTASGGAFRDLTYHQLKNAKAADALMHPNWKMGKKVTIDCATLMNKGMEIIEAKHLFGTCDIRAVQHKESIVHALAVMKDNSVIAALSMPDMTLPIQLALTYPMRQESGVAELDLATLGSLNFSEIDEHRFPCFRIAKEVSRHCDSFGCVMNSANEVAVKAYLDDKIGFYDIPRLIEDTLGAFSEDTDFEDLRQVQSMDKAAAEYTFKRIYGGLDVI